MKKELFLTNLIISASVFGMSANPDNGASGSSSGREMIPMESANSEKNVDNGRAILMETALQISEQEKKNQDVLQYIRELMLNSQKNQSLMEQITRLTLELQQSQALVKKQQEEIQSLKNQLHSANLKGQTKILLIARKNASWIMRKTLKIPQIKQITLSLPNKQKSSYLKQ